MISIALTTYNGAKYIEEQLMSILNQTLVPDEVVICDDASLDDTVEKVETFIKANGQNNWKLYRNEGNMGYIKNFCNAMKKCTGDFVFLSDQDDIWHKNKLETMMDVFKKNSSVIALASSYRAVDSEGNPLKEKFAPLSKVDKNKNNDGSLIRIEDKYLLGNVAQGCTCAYKKECVDIYLNKVTKYAMPHDWALNFIANEKNGLFFLDEELIDYRIHQNNTLGVIKKKISREDRIKSFEKYRTEIEETVDFLEEKKDVDYIRKIIDFTDKRIDYLKTKKIGIYVSGLIKYGKYLPKDFLLSYGKDFFE